MTAPTRQKWQSVRDEVRQRIHAREWPPGALIPNEADLATEFGCARTTVNRALRSLAETGLLDRRRKAGTRVAQQPVAKATFDIPIMRKEVEARGKRYRHELLSSAVSVPPAATAAAMGCGSGAKCLRLRALHHADERPYALEDRWVNLAAVPEARNEPFSEISANEWLLMQVPYTHGAITFSATSASNAVAIAMGCKHGASLFTIDRLTWNKAEAVTKVRILFQEGHQLQTLL
ncbi:MAG: UTRA domain-containing protein [Pseudomonadota bacterium]